MYPLELLVKKLPKTEPLIKLTPIMKLIGSLTVSLKIKLTLRLVELFWMLIISNKNKDKLKVKFRNIFFSGNNIVKSNLLDLYTYYKLRFY